MVVVYATDRRLYKHLPMAINSLLTFNPKAKVYIIAEDDKIDTIQRTKNITIINKNNYLDYVYNNITKQYGYFSNVKCFLTKFINEDKVLYLDVDTIVLNNLNELWDTNIDNYAMMACCENFKGIDSVIKQNLIKYFNAGVLLMNLKFIREHKLDDILIDYLNNVFLQYPDQDALNIICNGLVKFFGIEYNYSSIAAQNEFKTVRDIKIYHMMTWKLWDHPDISPETYKRFYIDILREE